MSSDIQDGTSSYTTVWDVLHLSGAPHIPSSINVPHAWLLLGPTGSGKRATALAMAAAFNCPELPDVGCGVCSTCTRIITGRHPDLHQFAPEGQMILVETIRTGVIPEAARSPFEGRRKVFVIEEAERMHPSAQNALLKTLEEPPEDTIIILVCDQEDELLETVRSRCRVVHFQRVPCEAIQEILEAEGAEASVARLAARIADGDINRARSFALEPEAQSRHRSFAGVPARLTSSLEALDAAAEIVTEAATAVKERSERQKQEVVDLAAAMGEGRGTASARASLVKRHKRELRRLENEVLNEALWTVASWYRDVMAARRRAPGAIANLDLTTEVGRWAAASEPDDGALVAAIHRCAVTPGALARNANPSLAIEATLVELARLAPPPPEPITVD
ncbi:MAG: DNA polymerase III subunit delta' [Actinomycetota bacterium]|nr:DNA polymerase III subunit delta' [Actinomycetota bacterium]